jgi:crotonobetainyl-CoA:carnitine CoA-transferase CaiB-like acyl-CoA transferase
MQRILAGAPVMNPTEQLPLSGIRVADFSWFGAGPIAGLAFANLGAEVIRVESESHMDGLRLGAPAKPNFESPNASGYYNNFNAGKLSFTLNLGHPGAREVALDLLRRSDVMIENYTPRVVEKWGLTYEEVAAVNPSIIYANMPMQGTWGPHRDFLGFGGVLAPVTGFSYLAGWPDRPPIGIGTNYPDYVVNPGHCVVAVLAALRYRARTGKGQKIELAQIESTVAALGPALVEAAANGHAPERIANRVPHAAPHGAYPCTSRPQQGNVPNRAMLHGQVEAPMEDRWLAIAVFTDEQWEALKDVMGRPAWAEEARFGTLLGRKANEDELEANVATWTATLEAEEAMRLLQAKGVPAGVVQTAEDVVDHDEHMKARGFYVYLDHPEIGRSAYDGPAFRLSETPARLGGPAPLLGQHNDYVLRDVLGYDDERIAELLVEQVVY